MKATTLLGLDFGERRIGVALSDPGKTLATGLMTIDTRRTPNYLEALADIIREEEVAGIVVGYPLRTDGKVVKGAKTEAVDAFITQLEKRFSLPVYKEDESFTSQLAADSLRMRHKRGGGQSNRKHSAKDKEDIDRVAACYILQDYLDGQARSTSRTPDSTGENAGPTNHADGGVGS